MRSTAAVSAQAPPLTSDAGLDMDMEDIDNQDNVERQKHSDTIARLSKTKALLLPEQDAEAINLLDSTIQFHKTAIMKLKPLSHQLGSLQAAISRRRDKLLQSQLQLQQLSESVALQEEGLEHLSQQELILKQEIRQESLSSTDFPLPDSDPTKQVAVLSAQMMQLQSQAQQYQAQVSNQQHLHTQQLDAVKSTLSTLAQMPLPEEAKTLLEKVLAPATPQVLQPSPGSPLLQSSPTLFAPTLSPGRSRSTYSPYPTSGVNTIREDHENKENLDITGTSVLGASQMINTEQSPLGDTATEAKSV